MKTKDEIREIAVAKWNADIPKLEQYILNAPDEEKAHEVLMWSLVWQEVIMYIHLGRQVEFEDFQIIVERRGFNEAQKAYLKEMLIHIGIGDILSGQLPAVLEAAEKKAQEAEDEYTKKEVAPTEK